MQLIFMMSPLTTACFKTIKWALMEAHYMFILVAGSQLVTVLFLTMKPALMEGLLMHTTFVTSVSKSNTAYEAGVIFVRNAFFEDFGSMYISNRANINGGVITLTKSDIDAPLSIIQLDLVVVYSILQFTIMSTLHYLKKTTLKATKPAVEELLLYLTMMFRKTTSVTTKQSKVESYIYTMEML